jgi:hypothetical protein
MYPNQSIISRKPQGSNERQFFLYFDRGAHDAATYRLHPSTPESQNGPSRISKQSTVRTLLYKASSTDITEQVLRLDPDSGYIILI